MVKVLMAPNWQSDEPHPISMTFHSSVDGGTDFQQSGRPAISTLNQIQTIVAIIYWVPASGQDLYRCFLESPQILELGILRNWVACPRPSPACVLALLYIGLHWPPMCPARASWLPFQCQPHSVMGFDLGKLLSPMRLCLHGCKFP